MKAAHIRYKRARQKVVDAAEAASTVERGYPEAEPPPEHKALAKACAELRASEAEVADELEAAWARNVAAVQAAKQRCVDTTIARARLEDEISRLAFARRLDPTWPIDRPLVTEDEQASLDEALAVENAAIEANKEAEVRFKQGVFVEQLEAG